MEMNLCQKILANHLLEGEMSVGEEIGIRIDHTLTQDTTGTMAYLAFETLDIPKTKAELSVSYLDHNTLQTDFRNADDHMFLQTFAKKHGVYYSKPGNGICHTVHLQRFAKPGKTMIGSDSHTPTSGAMAMIAIGVGGMNVAMAMAGQPFYLKVPQVVNVELKGELKPGVASKDIILKVLSIMTVKGGLGKVVEYTGAGVKTLSIPERATITNMGAELGATTSIFPSDEITRKYLKDQNREDDWTEMKADEGAIYQETIEIDLSELKPLIAKPHMPDNVTDVDSLKGMKVQQIFIGSCTNSSYTDLAKVAQILKGKIVHEDVSLSIAPGSRQIFQMLSRDGILEELIASGARILESACGPCIGIGQSPSTNAISLRTNNRNFIGRSGTADAQIYLVSPEVAAVSALTGVLSSPMEYSDIDKLEDIDEPMYRPIDDRMIMVPSENPEDVKVIKGPNIREMPIGKELEEEILADVILKVGDNITTDDIMPAGAKIMSLRSNIPEISEYVYKGIDPEFKKRALEMEISYIVGGENYGQGSSREHAALAPMYLGVKAVLAKSIARIHKDNLINYGVLPLIFNKSKDYDAIEQGDELKIVDIKNGLTDRCIRVMNVTKKESYNMDIEVSDRQMEVLLAGGQLNWVKEQNMVMV